MSLPKPVGSSAASLVSIAEKPARMEATYQPYQYYREHSQSVFQASSPTYNNDTSRLKKVQRLQRINMVTSTVLSLISNTLATALTIIMAYVLYKFYTTKNIAAPEAHRTSPWAKGTQLWPALLLAISSFLTLLAEIGEFAANCCGSRVKNAEKIESSFTTAKRVIWVVNWVAVAVLYRIGRTTKDLWGWSCDTRADHIQQFYPELDFHQLCTVQTTAWFMSMSMAGLKVVLLAISFCLIIKAKKLKVFGSR